HQAQVVVPGAADAPEGVDQSLEILVRLDVADGEQKRMLELVALPHLIDLIVCGRDQEPLVDRVVDDVDLFLGDIVEAEDVALGRFGDRRMRTESRAAVHIDALAYACASVPGRY